IGAILAEGSVLEVLACRERIFAYPGGRFVVLTLDVLFQLAPLDAPLPPATDLDRGQLAAAYHVVDLRHRDVKLFGDVGHEQEPGLHAGGLPDRTGGAES